MRVQLQFYSYFKDLAGTAATSLELPANSTVADLLSTIEHRFPRLTASKNSVLVAVGLDYQPRSYQLKDCDQVSIFPPVQGG